MFKSPFLVEMLDDPVVYNPAKLLFPVESLAVSMVKFEAFVR